jgi:hypothetical protein
VRWIRLGRVNVKNTLSDDHRLAQPASIKHDGKLISTERCGGEDVEVKVTI